MIVSDRTMISNIKTNTLINDDCIMSLLFILIGIFILSKNKLGTMHLLLKPTICGSSLDYKSQGIENTKKK